jgi:dUTP pyrophosphatase
MWDLLTSRVRERKIMDKIKAWDEKFKERTKYTGPDFKIELLEGGKMPTKANPTDACWDCYATVLAPQGKTPDAGRVVVEAGQGVYQIPLGFKLEIPEGWEAVLRGRSGLARGGVIAHTGTIDHTYREEVCALMYVLDDVWNVEQGYRVCQMSFSPMYQNKLVEGVVTPSSRGGFGSTGK